MVVTIQYASDLHLEFQTPKSFQTMIDPISDILVLAGDIGNPFKKIYLLFLQWCRLNFKHIVLIPGNHEYYRSSLKKSRKKMKELCADTGVIFLDRGFLELPEYGVVLIGTTLWSNIPSSKKADVLMNINDYNYIEGFSVDINNALYKRNVEWLSETIKYHNENNPSYKIVVVTHHAPVPEITSSPIYRGKSTNCAFASDCTSIMDGVSVWIYGHTHYSTTFSHMLPSGKTVIITANQRGYPSEKTGYQKNCHIIS